MNQQTINLIIPTLILFLGVIDDLRSRKVHNRLVVALMVAAALSSLAIWGLNGLIFGLIAALVAIVIGVPLVIAGVIGAGDMKLMVAFGLATSWTAVMWVFIYSLIWGALLGVFRAILRGEGRMLFVSTMSVAMFKKGSPLPLQKIPYTVALFFGWLTLLSLTHMGSIL